MDSDYNSDNLTPEQNDATEQAYQAAFRRWAEQAQPDSSPLRYFFYAGAELGLEMAQRIYEESRR